VATAGKYEAIVHYTCAEADVGSNIVLNVGDVQWKGTIAKAYESPLRGKDADRVPRKGESYMKDFQPLSLGMMDLPKGAATLSLSATSVAKVSVADVLAVELVLKK
jgi:hypothetical protein